MDDYTMEKIMKLNETQFRLFAKDGKTKEVKNILGIPSNKKYGIGDSMVMTKMHTEPNDVLKMDWNGREVYYVVINPIDEQMAFCFSIYPK